MNDFVHRQGWRALNVWNLENLSNLLNLLNRLNLWNLSNPCNSSSCHFPTQPQLVPVLHSPSEIHHDGKHDEGALLEPASNA